MKVKNNSKHNYVHSYMDKNFNIQMLILKPGMVLDVPDDVAKGWIKSKEVVEYVDPDLARKEKEKLEAENAKLKAELEAKKAEAEVEEKVEKPKAKRTTRKKK